MGALNATSPLNALGWQPKVSLADGLHAAYQDFLQQHPADILDVADKVYSRDLLGQD